MNRSTLSVAVVGCFFVILAGCQGPENRTSAEAEDSRRTGYEVVATMTEPPGNVAVTPDGRIILSLHQFYEPKWRTVELLPDGSLRPYPNESWADGRDDGQGFDAVLGLRADGEGNVWFLDNGKRSGVAPQLVQWDVRRNELVRTIAFPQRVLVKDSFLNDLAVDTTHNAIYITDSLGDDRAALLVVDLDTGDIHRVLQGHRSVVPKDVDIVVDGRVLMQGGSPRRLGVDGITIDNDHAWVYYLPMTGRTLWRVPTAALLDTSMSDEQLATHVERYGDRPVSDGITMDGGGNVYITDVGASGIGVTRPDGNYKLLFRDEQQLSWPDGMSTAPDGSVYVTVNKLHRSPGMTANPTASPPYYLVRFRPLAPTEMGR